MAMNYVSAESYVNFVWLEVQLAAAYQIQTQKLGVVFGWERHASKSHPEIILEQLRVGDFLLAVPPCADGADEEDLEGY